jgi:hypothetical protein
MGGNRGHDTSDQAPARATAGSAQTPMAAAWLVFGAGANGGARSASSRDPAPATKIARIASGSSTVAIKRRRPPQRGHASTSMSEARRIRSAHAQ